MKYFLLTGLITLSLSIACFGQEITMFDQARSLSSKFEKEISQLPPPPRVRQTYEVLKYGSFWLIADARQTPANTLTSPLRYWGNEALWTALREIGFNALYLRGLKESSPLGDPACRTGLTLDPRWGTYEDYLSLSSMANKRSFFLVGDLLRRSTGIASDFISAVLNRYEYPSLYQMVEIAPSDWSLLPTVAVGTSYANVPWLMLQNLEKRGYIPSHSSPYTKKSAWNATETIVGLDGETHRWIYAEETPYAPLLSWLRPSFASEQIAASDILLSTRLLDERILDVDGALPAHVKETLSLFTRKLGGYTIEEPVGGLSSLKASRCDFSFDFLTRSSLLHALITQETEMVELLYRLFLKEEIAPMGLVHFLQPLDRFTCEWTEFLMSPKKKYPYKEEMITGEILRQRLLKADLEKLGPHEKVPFSTWAGLCASALGIDDYEMGKEKIKEAHLLFAFFYAMQPGIFALSSADLLGALPSTKSGTLDLLEGASTLPTLYPSLTLQLQKDDSFASQIRHLASLRSMTDIALAELTAVIHSKNPGVLLLLHRLPSGLYELTAINVSTANTEEVLERSEFSNTTAINLVTDLAEPKIFASPVFKLSLLGMTGKAILFQPKHYPDQ